MGTKELARINNKLARIGVVSQDIHLSNRIHEQLNYESDYWAGTTYLQTNIISCRKTL